MLNKQCIAMLLAGGQGNRLGVLTHNLAKPAVPFGGKYRIIDFPLSNCTNSGIDTIGVLTQYRPLKLNAYIGTGQPWDLDRLNGGVFVLPPYVKGKKSEWYKGTANAIFQNLEFIEQYDPKYVLVLSGDHIYKMDYSAMIKYHEKQKADATIAVISVPWDEASRFGIMNTDEEGKIFEFEEKPKSPKNNMASMGIYVFNWEMLKQYLIEDDEDTKSSHDFGKNVIPKMLSNNLKLYAYPFSGYWKDVGTIQSLWEANMDLIESPPAFDLYDPMWRIYGRNPIEPPHYVAAGARVKKSIVTEGSVVYGEVEHSVIFAGVKIGKGAYIKDSIIMPDAVIGQNTRLNHVIVGEGVIIGDNCEIGFGELVPNKEEPDIYYSGLSVIGEGINITDNVKIGRNCVVQRSVKEPLVLESGCSVRKEDE
jgi:glucose-1-phosphate adenylyltransferase